MQASNYQHTQGLKLAAYIVTFPLHFLPIAYGAMLCSAALPLYPTKWDIGRRILPCAYGVLGIIASVVFIVLIERAAGANSTRYHTLLEGLRMMDLGTISLYHICLLGKIVGIHLRVVVIPLRDRAINRSLSLSSNIAVILLVLVLSLPVLLALGFCSKHRQLLIFWSHLVAAYLYGIWVLTVAGLHVRGSPGVKAPRPLLYVIFVIMSILSLLPLTFLLAEKFQLSFLICSTFSMAWGALHTWLLWQIIHNRGDGDICI